MNKQCRRCFRELPLNNFDKSTRLGYQTWCKECYRIWRRDYGKRDYRKEAKRKYKQTPRYKAYMKEYYSRPEVRERYKKHSKKYHHARENRIKNMARAFVNNSIASGKLLKKPCQLCGNKKSHAHHYDYTKPLEITWLCSLHHAEEHRNIKLRKEVKSNDGLSKMQANKG